MIFMILALSVKAVIDCETCVSELVSSGGCSTFVEESDVLDLKVYVSKVCGVGTDCSSIFEDNCKQSCKDAKIPGCDYKSCCVEKPLALCSTTECTKVYGYCCIFEEAPGPDKNDFVLDPSVVPTADPTVSQSCESCVKQLVEGGGCQIFSDSQEPLDPNSYVSKDCHDRTECSMQMYYACEESCKTKILGCDHEGCCGEKPFSLCYTKACQQKYGYCCQIEVVKEDKNTLLELNPAIVPTADPSGALSSKSQHHSIVPPCRDCDDEFVNNGGCAIYAHDHRLDTDKNYYISAECNIKSECSLTTYAACKSYCVNLYIAGCDYDICCSDNPSAFCFTTECMNIVGFCCDIINEVPMTKRNA